MTEPVDRREQLQRQFVETHGYWDSDLAGLLELDPEFLQRYVELANAAATGVLDPKVRELVLLAVDAAATSLYRPGVERHTARAIELGATTAEVLEVLQLASTVGVHACNIGIPMLAEEVAARRGPRDDPPLSPQQEDLKRSFVAARGYWNTFWHDLLRISPDFFGAYLNFSSHPWRHGVLEPKVKEFVYIAFDAAATHLFQPGLRQHIGNALDLGASQAEIAEVLQLSARIGIHACSLGVPALLRAAGEVSDAD